MERTLSIIKPDGVKKGVIGEIIKRFEHHGFEIRAMEMEEVYYLLEGSNLFQDRQNKAMERQTNRRTGRQSIDSLDRLLNVHGIKVKKKK